MTVARNWHVSMAIPRLVLAFAASAGALGAAQAGRVAYDNTTNNVGTVLFEAAAEVNGSLTDNMDADDLSVDTSFAGQAITRLTFEAYSNNSVSVVARPTFFLWAANSAGTAPGVLLGDYVLAPTLLAGGAQTEISTAIGSASPLIPANGKFWAGVSFDDANGTTGISASQLEALGGELFDPPTVGTSNGLVAVFLPPTSGPAGVDNPNVIPFNFGNSPAVNYGWRVEVSPVPEPGTAALIGAGFGLMALAVRRRRARHAD